jgi:hypothetical protein
MGGGSPGGSRWLLSKLHTFGEIFGCTSSCIHNTSVYFRVLAKHNIHSLMRGHPFGALYAIETFKNSASKFNRIDLDD